jgi:hypothetical protein
LEPARSIEPGRPGPGEESGLVMPPPTSLQEIADITDVEDTTHD